jgi:hypothetical protein
VMRPRYVPCSAVSLAPRCWHGDLRHWKLEVLSHRPVRHCLRQAPELNCQAVMYRLAVMPGVDNVSPDDGIGHFSDRAPILSGAHL